MKRIKLILTIVITAIISVTIGVVADEMINANRVNYNNSTVKNALDYLYTKTNKNGNILWEISDNRAKMDAFDVDINLDDYNQIMVVGAFDYSSSTYPLGFYSIVNVGETKTMRADWKSGDYNTREVTVTENKVSFKNGMWKTSACSGCMIPHYIIGIK